MSPIFFKFSVMGLSLMASEAEAWPNLINSKWDSHYYVAKYCENKISIQGMEKDPENGARLKIASGKDIIYANGSAGKNKPWETEYYEFGLNEVSGLMKMHVGD